MTIHTAEGRRRAPAPARDFGDDPTAPPAPPTATAEALAYTRDRLDRVDGTLDELGATIRRLEEKLAPALPRNGQLRQLDDQPVAAQVVGDDTEIDHRSRLAQEVSGIGLRAQQQGDRLAELAARVIAIRDDVEV